MLLRQKLYAARQLHRPYAHQLAMAVRSLGVSMQTVAHIRPNGPTAALTASPFLP